MLDLGRKAAYQFRKEISFTPSVFQPGSLELGVGTDLPPNQIRGVSMDFQISAKAQCG